MPQPPPFYSTGPQQTIAMQEPPPDWRRNLAMAEQIVSGATQGAPVQSPWEGLARLGQIVAGTIQKSRAEKQRGSELDMVGQVLKERGVDLGGLSLGSIPEEMRNTLLAQAILPGEAAKPIEINGKLIDPNTYEVIGDYNTPDYGFTTSGGALYRTDPTTGEVTRVAGDSSGGTSSSTGAVPKTTGLPEGYQWGTDANGQAIAVPIPGLDAAGAPASPLFEGTGMDQQAYNILLTGDPNSPVYAAAWAHLSQPKVQIDQSTGRVITITPDLSQFAQPPGATMAAAGAPSGGVQAGSSYVTEQPGLTPSAPNIEESKAAGFAERLSSSNGIIGQNEGAITLGNQAVSGIPVVGNFLVSEDYQAADQAMRDFVNAQLRRESGAVITDEEFANARKQYFPVPGDSPAVIEQKRRAREIAVQNMATAAGPSYDPGQSTATGTGASYVYDPATGQLVPK